MNPSALQIEGGGGPKFALGLAHRQCPLIRRRVRFFISIEQIRVHRIVHPTFDGSLAG